MNMILIKSLGSYYIRDAEEVIEFVHRGQIVEGVFKGMDAQRANIIVASKIDPKRVKAYPPEAITFVEKIDMKGVMESCKTSPPAGTERLILSPRMSSLLPHYNFTANWVGSSAPFDVPPSSASNPPASAPPAPSPPAMPLKTPSWKHPTTGCICGTCGGGGGWHGVPPVMATPEALQHWQALMAQCEIKITD